MGLEASELMTAGALFFPNRVLDTALSSNKNLGDFMETAKKKVETNVDFGSNRNEFLEMMVPSPAMMKELVMGISAAKAVKKWVTQSHGINQDSVADKVFMTGNVWPDEVAPLAISAHGFDAYNSSDLVIKPLNHPNSYFGISIFLGAGPFLILPDKS